MKDTTTKENNTNLEQHGEDESKCEGLLEGYDGEPEDGGEEEGEEPEEGRQHQQDDAHRVGRDGEDEPCERSEITGQ